MNFFSHEGPSHIDSDEDQLSPNQIHVSSEGLQKRSKKIIKNKRPQQNQLAESKRWFSIRAISSSREVDSQQKLIVNDLRNQKKYDFDLQDFDKSLMDCEDDLCIKIMDRKSSNLYYILFTLKDPETFFTEEEGIEIEDVFTYEVQKYTIDPQTKEICKINLFIVEIHIKKFTIVILESIKFTIYENQ